MTSCTNRPKWAQYSPGILRVALFASLFLVCSTFFIYRSHAAISPVFSYQGQLTNAVRSPLANVTRNMTFRIYDVPTGGTPLILPAETQTVTTSSNGVFSVLIKTENLNFNGTAFYLGVEIDADGEMSPRKRLTVVPQAVNANNLIGDGYLDITGNAYIGGTDNLWDGLAPKLSVRSEGYRVANFSSLNDISEITIGNNIGPDGSLAIGYSYTENYGWIHVWGDDIGTGLVIADGGGIGIGTTDPIDGLDIASGGLHVRGTAQASNASEVLVDYISGNGRILSMGPDAGTRGGLVTTLCDGEGGECISPLAISALGNVGIGTITPTDFTLQIVGNVGPDQNNLYDLGSTDKRWRDIYAGPASLHIGEDGNEATIGYNTISNQAELSETLVVNGDVLPSDNARNLGAPYIEGNMSESVFSGSNDNDNFGYSIAAGDINGDGYDDMIVGSAYAAGGGNSRGEVNVYYGNQSGSLSAIPDLTFSGINDNSSFGYALAAGDINNDGYADVMVGAPDDGTGKVYVFYGNGDTVVDLTFSDIGRFGYSVATGDINNDGYADMVAGAPENMSQSGKVNVYYGNDDETADLTFSSSNAYEYLGYSVATGDINNDGYADVVVGVPAAPFGWWAGEVRIYYGNDDETADLTLSLSSNYDQLGFSVATGDVNGDGYADVVIGVPGYSGGAWRGEVLVYYSNDDGVPDLSLIGDGDGDSMGYAVATGDVNRDGYADVIAGVPGYPNGDWRGKVNVYYGNDDDVSDLTFLGPSVDDNFGYSLATGDMSSDGYADVLVGAPGAPSGNQRGAVHLYQYQSPTPDQRWNNIYSRNIETDSLVVNGDLSVDNILPNADNVFSLGSATNRFKDLYLGPGSLHLGEDGNEGVISFDAVASQLNISSATVFDGSITLPMETSPGGSVSNLNFGGRASGAIFIDGNYVYMGVSSYGLVIVDITDPLNPSWVSSFDDFDYGPPQDIYVRGNYAYIADGGPASLVIVDVSDRSNPVRVGSVATGGYSTGVFVAGDYAYVATQNNLQIVNITDPTNPQIVGSYEDSAFDVAVAGNYAYVGGYSSGFYVLDVSNPTSPELVINLGGWSNYVKVFGNYAYSLSNSTLVIIDISTPTDAQIVTWYSPSEVNTYGIDVSGNRMVMAHGGNNVTIIDVSDPANPEMIDWASANDYASNVGIAGEYAYVADGDAGLTVVSVGSPERRIGIGTLDPRNLLDVAGGAVIGSSYAGSATAPSNGLIVEGYVGIGLDNPMYALDVAGDANVYGNINVVSGNFLLDGVPMVSSQWKSYGSDVYFNAGKVGIGKTSPDYQLDVAGNASIMGKFLVNDQAPGTLWTARDSNHNWMDIAISADGQYQTATTSGEQIYTSSDYGANWTGRNSNRAWRKVAISDDGRYQLATAILMGGGSQVYTSSDYGATWTFRLGPSGSLIDVAISADGQYQTFTISNGQIYTSSNYGVNWTGRDSNRSWSYVAMSDDGKYQVATTSYWYYNGGGYLYVSSDYGVTWNMYGGTGYVYWRSIDISTDGQYQTAVTYNNQIFVSSNYGVTWTQTGPSVDWTKITMSSDGQYQTAIANDWFIYVSSDYGVNWDIRMSDVTRSWGDVAMSDDGQFQTAIVQRGQIYASSDFGVSWSGRDSSQLWYHIAMSADGQHQTAIMNDFWQTGVGRLYTSEAQPAKIGIGTFDPDYSLDVAGDINITGNYLINGVPIAGGSSQWTTNGLDIYYNTGNIGVGTSTPSSLFDLQKSGIAKNDTSLLEITNSGNAADMDGTLSSILFNQYYYDATTPSVADAGKIAVGTETDWTSLASTQDSYLNFSTALDGAVAEKMRITSNGNVGIGNVSPQAKLQLSNTDLAQPSFAVNQTGGGTFLKTFGGIGSDAFHRVSATPDGGYLAYRYAQSYGAGLEDGLIAKYDASGNLLWTKTIGGVGSDFINAIVVDSDGGFTALGTTTSYGAGSYDAMLAKYDASGNLIWVKTAGGSGWDNLMVLIRASDGGYIAAGTTNSYGAGSYDGIIIRYDVSGNLLWTKTLGGASDESINAIAATSDGGFVISGTTTSYGAGSYDAMIAKYDASGNLIWVKTAGGSGMDMFNAVVVAPDNSYIVSGSTYSYGAGSADGMLAKYDVSGGLLWMKTLGGAGSDSFSTVINNLDGGYTAAGSTDSYGAGSNDGLIAKYDSTGNLLWAKTSGGSGLDVLSTIISTSDGGYIGVGLTSSYGLGSNDVLFAKYDSSGNIPGCSGCQSASPGVASPSPSTTSPSPSTTSPSPSISSPSPSITSPSPVVATRCAATGEDRNVLTLSAPNGYLGLGIANPLSRLDVNGGVAIGSYAGNSAAPNNGMIVSGNVGIGTASPNNFKLQVAGNIGPNLDDQYDLGSAAYRWRDLYLGPTSLHIASTALETTTARDWEFSIQEADGATEGNLRISEGMNELLAITPSGNIGIGTAIPSSMFDLQKSGATKNDTSLLEITNSGNAADMDGTLSSILFNQYYYDATTPSVADAGKIAVGTETDWTSLASTQDSYLNFSTALDGAVAEKMRITSNGNVGIGNVSPVAKLDILSNVNAVPPTLNRDSMGLNVSNTYDLPYSYGDWNYSYGVKVDNSIPAINSRDNIWTQIYGGSMSAQQYGSGVVSYILGVTGSAGNWGSGNVYNDIMGGSFSAHSGFGGGSANNIYGVNSDASAFGYSAGDLLIPRLYGVISTAQAANYDNYNLSVTDAYGMWTAVGGSNLGSGTTEIANAYGYYFGNDVPFEASNITIQNQYGLYLEHPTHGVTSNYALYSAGGTNYFGGSIAVGTASPGAYKMLVSGSLGINSSTADKVGGGSWGTYSDARLKDVQGDYGYGLESIMQINPIRYIFKSDNALGINEGDKEFVGVVAQEIQNIIPEAVYEGGDGYLRVNNDPIIWASINAIQEQQIQIAGQQTTLSSLSLQTDQNITTLSELQTSIDEQLGVVSQSLVDQAAAIADQASLVATLQTQIAELQTKLNTETNLAQVDLNTQDITLVKTILGTDRVANPGDVDLLGKLSAETVETGMLVINVIDPATATIGQNAITPVTVDMDLDGVDDVTGSDGKSVVVKTTAVANNIKVFVTPKRVTKQPLAVTTIVGGESFRVEIADPIIEDLVFDWWIVAEGQ